MIQRAGLLTVKQGWARLRQCLSIEQEQGIGSPGMFNLGCDQERSLVRLPSGRLATVMPYDVEVFLESGVEHYTLFAHLRPPLRVYCTRILPEDHQESPARDSGTGPVA